MLMISDALYLLAILAIACLDNRCCAFSNSFLPSRRIRIRHDGNNIHRRHASRRTCTSKRHRAPTSLSMALEVKVRIVGRKNAEEWLDDGYAVYEKRLRPANVNIETIYHKSDNELIKGVSSDKEKNHAVVLLDPLGRTLTSEEFSIDMYNWLDEGGSRLTFVIGGAEGLPYELRGDMYSSNGGTSGCRAGQSVQQKKNIISLSAMTFTHQFARTVLIEQIYRASEIRKGSGYHK